MEDLALVTDPVEGLVHAYEASGAEDAGSDARCLAAEALTQQLVARVAALEARVGNECTDGSSSSSSHAAALARLAECDVRVAAEQAGLAAIQPPELLRIPRHALGLFDLRSLHVLEPWYDRWHEAAADRLCAQLSRCAPPVSDTQKVRSGAGLGSRVTCVQDSRSLSLSPSLYLSLSLSLLSLIHI